MHFKTITLAIRVTETRPIHTKNMSTHALTTPDRAEYPCGKDKDSKKTSIDGLTVELHPL